jgi:HEAT repeat protein
MRSKRNLMLISFLILITIGMLLSGGCAPSVDELKDKQDIWGLIDILNYGSDTEVQASVEALVDIGEPAVGPLIETIKDDMYGGDILIYTVVALGEIGDSRAVEPLIEVLKNEDINQNEYINYKDINIKENAAVALGKIGDSRAVEPLISALKDEYGNVQESIIEALVKIGEPSIEPLIKALGDEDWDIYKNAAVALVDIGELAVESLIEALKYEDEDTQWEVVEVIEDIGEPAIEPLIKALKNKDILIRSGAVTALGAIGDNRAVEPLVEVFLKDEDENIRDNAMYILKDIGEPAVEPLMEALIGALKDESEDIRQTAADNLNNFIGDYELHKEYIYNKFGDFLQTAGLVCDTAFKAPITGGSAKIPVFYLIKKDYVEDVWEIKWFRDYTASQISEIKTLVAICESRRMVGWYTPSAITGYQKIWNIRLISWPDGNVFRENMFTGSEPPEEISITYRRAGDDEYGDDPTDATLFDWLSEVLVE